MPICHCQWLFAFARGILNTLQRQYAMLGNGSKAHTCKTSSTTKRREKNGLKGHKILAHAAKTAPTGLKGHKKAQPAEITPTGLKGQAIRALVQLLEGGGLGKS